MDPQSDFILTSAPPPHAGPPSTLCNARICTGIQNMQNEPNVTIGGLISTPAASYPRPGRQPRKPVEKTNPISQAPTCRPTHFHPENSPPLDTKPTPIPVRTERFPRISSRNHPTSTTRSAKTNPIDTLHSQFGIVPSKRSESTDLRFDCDQPCKTNPILPLAPAQDLATRQKEPTRAHLPETPGCKTNPIRRPRRHANFLYQNQLRPAPPCRRPPEQTQYRSSAVEDQNGQYPPHVHPSAHTPIRKSAPEHRMPPPISLQPGRISCTLPHARSAGPNLAPPKPAAGDSQN